MRRLTPILLLGVAALGLAGCVVAPAPAYYGPPRGYYYAPPPPPPPPPPRYWYRGW
ncbi:hypothetical protein [Pseudoroseomonas cervicalis]|uniref:hypothetical protein n=1 Tax=Teichococcus cervicalis TaxID=204525 RepID=UPI0022F1C0C1|nr:hypothetical protein [Pseudoroseomonas cervicalis]WBV41494.1 hypothetical protein PFY06_09535 [Pseudoroseomonas cervicalis]